MPKQEVFGKLLKCSSFIPRTALVCPIATSILIQYLYYIYVCRMLLIVFSQVYVHEPLDQVQLLVKQAVLAREVLHASLNSYSLRMTMQVSEASDRITKVYVYILKYIILFILFPLCHRSLCLAPTM